MHNVKDTTVLTYEIIWTPSKKKKSFEHIIFYSERFGENNEMIYYYNSHKVY